MAAHFTIYPEQAGADALRTFMAAHNCSATGAVELLLARHADEPKATTGDVAESVRRRRSSRVMRPHGSLSAVSTDVLMRPA